MASKKRQSKTNDSSSDIHISLGVRPVEEDFGKTVDEDALWKACRKEVAQELGINAGRLTHESLPEKGKKCSELVSSDRNEMSSVEGKKVTRVLKWFGNERVQYWLGVRVCIANERCINTVSIMIARSFANSGDSPEAVLRAEWDYWPPQKNKDKGKGSPTKHHAQPHWHIYQLNRRAAEAEFQRIQIQEPISNGEIPIKEFGSEVSSNPPKVLLSSSIPFLDVMEGFHFSMCAYWNRNPPIKQWPISEVDLAHWLKHCLTYIKLQLQPDVEQ